MKFFSGSPIIKHLVYSVHAVFLLWVTLLLQETYYLFKDEQAVIQVSNILRDYIRPTHKPNPEEFLFINTSYDNALATIFDETGFIPMGNVPITDREALGLFFKSASANDVHKYILTDLTFDLQSEQDSLLHQYLPQTKRILVSGILNDAGQLSQPIFNVRSALTMAQILDDVFAKFRLVWQDTIKTAPLIIHEEVSGKELKLGWPLR
jgi:hypothetical protein